MKKADREKRACHAFTPAVRCEGGRQRKRIMTYTGVSLCELDDTATRRMAEVLRLVRADPHTLLAYTTVSGEGLRILFPFGGVPVEDADPAARETLQSYQAAYQQGNEYYARLMGLAYEGACKTPEAYLNPAALPLSIHPRRKKAYPDDTVRGSDCQHGG